MIHRLMKFLPMCLFFLCMEVEAQQQVSANGKFATINGLKIYYEEYGQGMPVVLVHHFFGTASQWKTYVPDLAKKYRVIVIDLPGHGRSQYMDTTKVYLHKKAGEYIIGLMDHLGLDSIHLMGASSGAIVTLYVAALRPDLVKRAIVIAGFLYRSKHVREIVRSWPKDPDANEIAAHGKEKAVLLHKQFSHFSLLYGDPSFTPDVLSSITAKTLIIHGDNDQIAPVSNALSMYENIPGANLWIVPNGGHSCFPPYLDSKNESDFIKRTMEFLNGDWEKK